MEFLSEANVLKIKKDEGLLKKFISGLPKAELHIHIEGSLEPEMMAEFAEKNGLTEKLENYKPENAQEFFDSERKKRKFNNLQEFLNLYYAACSVMKTEADFQELCFAYLKCANSDSVKRAEIFFDPQTHMFEQNSISLETIINGLYAGCLKARSEFGISSDLILCFLRHREEAEALEVLGQLIKTPSIKSKVLAVGLDSGEDGNPPSKFKNVYAKAKQAGFRLVAHAGEEAGPGYIYEALDILHVERIDHGVRCLEDEALVERLVKENILLTVCPSSNHRLQVVNRYFDGKSPVKRLIDAGVKICLNGDDPAYFFGHKDAGETYGGYISANYVMAAKECGLDANQLAKIASDSFAGSFASDEEKRVFEDMVSTYCAGFEAVLQ